ncbi:MAG: hypothetical protein M9958_13070 [Chitinophagales bacterium]|nr:hypothetical protein [Chitinophagales bacterium]
MDWIINNFRRKWSKVIFNWNDDKHLATFFFDNGWRTYGTPTSIICTFQQSDSLYEAIQYSYSHRLKKTMPKMLQRSYLLVKRIHNNNSCSVGATHSNPN